MSVLQRLPHMRLTIFGASIFALGLFQIACFGQENWDTYKSRTLMEIIENHKSDLGNGGEQVSILLTGDSFPSRVSLRYTGKSRKVTRQRTEVISGWAKSQKVNAEIVALFERELLFIEGPVEYWIPVQKQLIPYFQREVKEGEVINLFVIWIGARKEMDNIEWVFLGNEFNKLVVPNM
jgi:hypothetical protein